MTEDNAKHIPLIAVASVDLLGLKNLLSKNDNSKSAMTAIKQLRVNSCVDKAFIEKNLQSDHLKLFDHEMYFSDSLYFFADPAEAIGIQIDNLAVKCASLIAIGLFYYPNGFLVRAGIAVGDLRIEKVKTQKDEQEIRIGTSMAKAYTLQESQNWIGGAVENGYPGDKKDRNRFSYSVPLKNSYFYKCNWPQAINWPYIIPPPNNTKDKMKSLVENSMKKISDIGHEENIKLDNTKQFIEFYFNNITNKDEPNY